MAEKKSTKHEKSERSDRPTSTHCNRCGNESAKGICATCVDQIKTIAMLMKNPKTRPMTAAELDILVAEEGRVRGEFAPDQSN